jgi:hypothetical protein
MFRPTPPQRTLFGVEHHMWMDETKLKRLERSWAHQFRNHALPLIAEKPFAKYFCDDNGRPNASVRMVIGVLVLKDMFNLTDLEALEHLEWDTLWHYALDVTPQQAHTCQKTLHNFRAKLLADDQGTGLFEGTTARLIKSAGLRTKRQRQDSTHIVSNIKVLTRLGLFVETIRCFLEALRKEHPRICAEVADELLGRYLDREGYFADARNSEAPRRLEESALDLYYLVTTFGKHPEVKKMESFALCERLYREQCVPPESETPEKIVLQEKPGSSSLQSPSDPDVTYSGHKGKGYSVQLAETCDGANPFQVITAVEVNKANESDQNHALPVLAQTERTCEKAPEEMHADSGYASGENIVAAKEQFGTDLLAPIGSKASEQSVTLKDFEIDVEAGHIVRCPVGQAPIAHQPARNGRAMLALFAAAQCASCPLAGQCPTEPRGDHRVLPLSPPDLAVAKRRAEQETALFKQRHKIRSGIEATNSEMKRRHGLGKLRVRREPRVRLAVKLKALAVNLKRYLANLVEAAAQNAPAAACNC